jgi:hypothetical protein
MLYREIMASFRNHMQHKNIIFKQNVEILMINIIVYTYLVTTMVWGINYYFGCHFQQTKLRQLVQMAPVWIYFCENEEMPLELSQ